MSRAGALAAIVMVVLVVMAAPALADPAEPTNYRSIVNSIDPSPAGVAVEIVGGDAYLSVAAASGHSVLVPGYFGEPYLRIDADGTVLINTASPASFINRDRYGNAGVPDGVEATNPPVWDEVGTSGTYAWHDHRVHWMSEDLPPTVAGDRADIVFPWTVPMVIDGVETEVGGELFYFPNTNPAGPILTGILGVLPFLAYRPGRFRPVMYAGAGAGALMLAVAITRYAATPAFGRPMPVAAVLPALAVIAAIAALWRSDRWALPMAGVSGAALVAWAWTAAASLTAPVLPSQLPEGMERGAVSLSAWVGLGILGFAAFEIIRTKKAPSHD